MPDPRSRTVPELPDLTRRAALEAALAAVDDLAALGELVEEDWTYATALAQAGRARLRDAAGGDATTPLTADLAAAVVAACSEAARISDPHRAIDWLSTLPAVVELALTASSARDGAGPEG